MDEDEILIKGYCLMLGYYKQKLLIKEFLVMKGILRLVMLKDIGMAICIEKNIIVLKMDIRFHLKKLKCH